MNALALARACLQAYVDKDRAAIEALLADDFRFTSPYDNALDRTAYFARCWPNCEDARAFAVVESADLGDRAFAVYDAESTSKRFRNCEMYVARGGKLVAVEVYFGWDLPHPAPPGSFVANGT